VTSEAKQPAEQDHHCLFLRLAVVDAVESEVDDSPLEELEEAV